MDRILNGSFMWRSGILAVPSSTKLQKTVKLRNGWIFGSFSSDNYRGSVGHGRLNNPEGSKAIAATFPSRRADI